MRIGDFKVELRATQVTVWRVDRQIASGTWRGGRIVNRVGSLPATISWSEIETAIQADAAQLVEASQRSAHDARGVDVTQIDRMLALSPHERLRRLDAQRDAILRLCPHADRE